MNTLALFLLLKVTEIGGIILVWFILCLSGILGEKALGIPYEQVEFWLKGFIGILTIAIPLSIIYLNFIFIRWNWRTARLWSKTGISPWNQEDFME